MFAQIFFPFPFTHGQTGSDDRVKNDDYGFGVGGSIAIHIHVLRVKGLPGPGKPEWDSSVSIFHETP